MLGKIKVISRESAKDIGHNTFINPEREISEVKHMRAEQSTNLERNCGHIETKFGPDHVYSEEDIEEIITANSENTPLWFSPYQRVT